MRSARRVCVWPRMRWVECAWAAFAAANLFAIVHVPNAETLPFNIIWVSFTLLYARRLWPLRQAVLALVVVGVASGVAASLTVGRTQVGFDEAVELPLVAVMFLAMVLQVERRQAGAEQARRERELRDELDRQLLGDASHELRTPITIARGHAELLQAAFAGTHSVVDVQVILEELARLGRISDQILILSAARHADFLHREPVEFAELVFDAQRRWRRIANRRWTVTASGDATVLGDRERLATSLDALIENAVKFTNDGDAIAVRAYVEDGAAILGVSDTGQGIRSDQLQRIFDRFARGGSPGPESGSGLGLAIVKAVVEGHGGSVSVASEPGLGSTFEIRLSRYVGGERPAVTAPSEGVTAELSSPH